MNENIWEHMDENMDIMLEKQERTLDYSTQQPYSIDRKVGNPANIK